MLGAQCVRVNTRSALLIVICLFLNGVKFSNTGKLQKRKIVFALSEWREIIDNVSNMIPAINHSHQSELSTKLENHKNNSNLNADSLNISNLVSVAQIAHILIIFFFDRELYCKCLFVCTEPYWCFVVFCK